MAPFSSFVFDLDGTLLNTILDISLAINEALRVCGYSYSYSPDETKRLIGDGPDKCVERALAFHNEDLQGFSALKKAYMPLYKKMQNDHTAPFKGLKEVLTKMKQNGAKLYVVTNKPDALSQVVCAAHYGPDFFAGIIGQREGFPVKPNPASLLALMEEKGIPKEGTIYVGDSSVDLDTAANAGLPCALCLWGYGIYDETTTKRATYLLEKPEDLLNLMKE